MHNYDALQAALDGPLKPLTQYRQFMLWKLRPNPSGGKPRKYPYGVDGAPGSSTDPSRWTDAATALAAARRFGDMGVAFVFTKNDPYVFIDVDNCVANGKWNDDARDTRARFPGAAFEVSQSHNGMHLFVAGKTPENFTGNIKNGFECYRTDRFVALTGISSEGQIYDYGDALARFIADRFPATTPGANAPLTWTSGPIAEWNGPTDDEELLRQFLNEPAAITATDAFRHLLPDAVKVATPVNASNADLFNANVDVLSKAYPATDDVFDHSAAAFALATRLAYWTGKDCERMQRFMNRAAFRRSKAYEQHDATRTYMQWDIERACAVTGKVMFQRVVALNAEAVAERNDSYEEYADRLASAVGNVAALRAVADEIAMDGRPDDITRALLAEALHRSFELSDAKLPIAKCRKMTDRRAAHAAYDLKQAQRERNIALNVVEEFEPWVRDLSLPMMLDEFVFVANGSRVMSRYNRNLSYKDSEFDKMYAPCTTMGSDGKARRNSTDWLEHKMRMSVATRTFRAGHKVFTSDPDGIPSINTWRPRDHEPVASMDVTPFLEHIQFLFGDDAEPFLDWLAHIEQQPGELPHYGWLHIAPKMGTGRGWLSCVMSDLWRGYVAPSVDLESILSGGFNGLIGGRVLAIVDEIRAGAGENAYQTESKLRKIITEPTRSINAKYGGQYLEFNSCRWFVCSNHKDALPMPKDDRRWWVTHCPHDTYLPEVRAQWEARFVYLYNLIKIPQFIESIAAFLRARDLSGFNPGERPPLNAAKSSAIDAAKSEYARRAEQVVRYWPCDLITAADLLNIMNDGDMVAPARRIIPAMRHALEDAGMYNSPAPIYVEDNVRPRCWIVRNVDRWREAGKIATMAEFATKPIKRDINGAFGALMNLI
jgi:primase-polymerase (primpol)-like protein